MEALIAVGLAGNVVQFLQSAGTLISVAKSMRKGGKIDSLPDIHKLSGMLTYQATIISSRLKACSTTLAEEDQNLLDVATECEEAGAAFIAYLNSLVSNSSSKVVGIAKTTMKLGWSSPKIDEFVGKLDKLRSSLTLATVLAFRTSAESNHQEILAHLKEIQKQNQTLELAESKVTSSIQNLVGIVRDQTSDALRILQEEIRIRLIEINVLRDSLLLADRSNGREREILNWLDFRQVSWRFEGIDQAYQRTYEWIFKKTDDQIGWEDFTAHLQGNASSPYFINGKAGSGKSTLMKFIYGHQETNAALEKWAGSEEVVTLHFFFWNLGTNLQKSHVGMLRALLHSVLEQHPELIPAVLPRLYRNWKTSSLELEPDYVEMKKTFELMIEKSRYLKLAIFIDGIDEFEGDHRDMSLFLRSIVSPRVKLVVSSRPLNTCLVALADCPTLRLEDLTKRDMEAYVHGELTCHHLMFGLSQQFPMTALTLSTDLVEKAEGVFLWVKLVVCLLIEGLENGDDITELEARLESLPSDLKDLYKRMFGKMQGAYQKQAAVIFQLLRRWNGIVRDQPLPALVLSYAICTPSIVFDPTNSLITNEVFDWTMSSLEKRIRSRCCGLLEMRYNDKTVRGTTSAKSSKNYISIDEVNRSSITYLHRTVAEFIKMDEVWQEICSLTRDMAFDASTNLASACLFALKLGKLFDDRTVKWYVASAAHFIRTASPMSPPLIHKYIQELDQTVSKIRKETYSEWFHNPSYWELHWSAKPHNSHILTTDQSIERFASIYTFAAAKGLFNHPIVLPADLDGQARFVIVVHALWAWTEKADSYNFQQPSLDERSKTLLHILRDVSGPESVALNNSLWQQVLIICQRLLTESRDFEAAQLLKVVLVAAKSPRSLWQQSVLDIAFSPTELLDSLNSRCRLSHSKELDDTLVEIAQLLRSDVNLSRGVEMGHRLPRVNEQFKNSHSKGKTKSRRSRKNKARAKG